MPGFLPPPGLPIEPLEQDTIENPITVAKAIIPMNLAMLFVQKLLNMAEEEDFEDRDEITAQVKRISQRLRKEREKLRISQMNLSFKAGLSQNQVNYIETGKRTPNLYTFLSICNALQISPAVIFKPEDTERQQARETVIRFVSRFM